jgi:formyl-CoA transferase
LAGYDQIAQGTSGMMSLNATPEGPPTKVGVPIGDITAGMFAAQAILAALVERTRTGRGRHVDVALNDSLLALHTYQAGRLFATGEVPSREGNYHATIVPYGTFAVRDGFINVAVATDAQFRRFCEVLDATELADNPRFATNALRQAARPELNREIALHLSHRTREEWLARLEEHGIPAGPILDIKEAFDSALEAGWSIEPNPAGAADAGSAHRRGAGRMARLRPGTDRECGRQTQGRGGGFDWVAGGMVI